jgi:hypothetical protein
MAAPSVTSEARQALEALLDSLGESSSFVAFGSVAPVLPGLEVKGVGSIGAPITEVDARRLIAKATQAPYGRGAETIVDTDVRRVWQIEPSQITFRNAEWTRHVSSIVNAVKQELGIEEQVNAELYKLLIYEKGSFFAPHRDTEKTPGMFATMVVCLPSRHTGGTLIVKHEDRTVNVDFGGEESEFKTQYAAFYADCHHEILPVAAGHRICLVYNLAITGKKEQPSAPQYASKTEQAAGQLQTLLADRPDGPRKIAIPLEHQYTEAGLDPKHLKGADRARADVLARAAKSLNYECFVALLTIEQSGDVDYSTWDGGYGRSRSYDWSHSDEDDDEDEFGGGDDSGIEMGEIFDQNWSLDHWLDMDGQKRAFGEVHIEENEILNLEDKDLWSFRQEVHEATGNEGVSMERWYRQTVIVIWPGTRTFEILAAEGQASALPELERRVAHSKTPAALAECRAFASEIISHWERGQRLKEKEAPFPQRMLRLIDRLGDVQLAERFLADVFHRDYDGSEGEALVQVYERFGWEKLTPLLGHFVDQQYPSNHGSNLARITSICEALCSASPKLTNERRKACQSLVEPLERVIAKFDEHPIPGWRSGDDARAGVVARVVRILAAVGATEHLERFVSGVLGDQKRYDLHKVLIPDTKSLYDSMMEFPAAKPAARRLLEHCLEVLRAATAKPIEPPKDWSRPAELDCKCEDCRALSKFLCDPATRVGRFPLRKDRRQHLHQQIERHRCDCTHVTERKGSPQTLVCTKTQDSFERRRNQYDVDLVLIAELEALALSKKPAIARKAKPAKKPAAKKASVAKKPVKPSMAKKKS